MIKKYQLLPGRRKATSTLYFILLTSLFFCSCKIYQPAYYFKNVTRDTIISGFVNNDMELKIQNNDLLTISISSLSPMEDAVFNTAGKDAKGGVQVSTDGNIYLHKLGKVPAAGLTRKELKQKLEKDLLPFLKDPIVSVNFANHHVIVLGETTSQVVEMPEEKIPLLEVMAKSNPVTQNSVLDKVLVIRELPGAKQYKHLDLQEPGFINSPWYYLQPNDIVVVKPNAEKLDSEARRARNQLMFAILLSVVTFIFLITDRIF